MTALALPHWEAIFTKFYCHCTRPTVPYVERCNVNNTIAELWASTHLTRCSRITTKEIVK
jgi:hypothetical protein